MSNYGRDEFYERLGAERLRHLQEVRLQKPRCEVPIEDEFYDYNGAFFVKEATIRALSHVYSVAITLENEVTLSKMYDFMNTFDQEEKNTIATQMNTAYSSRRRGNSDNSSREFPYDSERRVVTRVDEEDALDRERIRQSIASIALSEVALSKPLELEMDVNELLATFFEEYPFIRSFDDETAEILFRKVLNDNVKIKLSSGVYILKKATINPLNDLTRSPKHERYGEYAI